MTWTAHVSWSQPAPEGAYGPGVELDHVRTFAGYPDSATAYEAARAFARTLRCSSAPEIVVGTGPDKPIDPERYRAWVAHAAAIQDNARHRVEAAGGHDHRRGWRACAICSTPGDYRRCGLPDCAVCVSPAPTPADMRR